MVSCLIANIKTKKMEPTSLEKEGIQNTEQPKDLVNNSQEVVDSPKEITPSVIMQDSVPTEQKIEIKQLHELQTEPKNLKFEPLKEVNGIQLEVCNALNFETHPDAKVKKQLDKLSETQNPLLFQIRVLKIIGGNVVFKQLFKEGVPTGLSHGTMDLIYRIGLNDPDSVDGLLDNIDLAVGCLQRRCQISDIIEKRINQDSVTQITTIAGGTCLLPLEAAYQSKKTDLTITNLDFSDRALQKGSKTLDSLRQVAGDRNIKLEYKNADLLSERIPEKSNNDVEIVECTGFWEYLSFSDRERLLGNISERMQGTDTFVLTALVNASESDVRILSALKFKQLYPQPVNEFITQAGNKFDIEKVALTPNGAYATLVLKKKASL